MLKCRFNPTLPIILGAITLPINSIAYSADSPSVIEFMNSKLQEINKLQLELNRQLDELRNKKSEVEQQRRELEEKLVTQQRQADEAIAALKQQQEETLAAQQKKADEVIAALKQQQEEREAKLGEEKQEHLAKEQQEQEERERQEAQAQREREERERQEAQERQNRRDGFIVNQLSGKCIDVAGTPGRNNGDKLILHDCELSGTDPYAGSPTDQKWTMNNGDFIINSLSGKCIDVAGTPGRNNGDKLILHDCEFSGTDPYVGSPTDQKWSWK